MYHYVYKTTNLINGKIYIGIHSTEDLDDGYIGSGVAFRHAVNKYGKENFHKEIIHECSTREEASIIEATLVTESFCLKSTNYNMRTGGDECYAYHPATRKKMSEARKGSKLPKYRVEQIRKYMLENNPMNNKDSRDKIRDAKLGVARSEELKKKVSDTLTGKYPAFLNPRVAKNKDLIKRWCLLDQIFDKYQEGHRYSTLLSFFGDYFPGETSMRSMVHYIKDNGDPRLDPRWVEFKLLNDTSE